MAPINQINTGEQDNQINNILSTWLTTVCLLVCMISSLVGIKIWWFKHRLNFEQSSTHNGATAGARGIQPMLRSTTKDKRSSQQVCDSVVVHGVFRKRHEDELDIVDRPRQLPPIRIPERSQSTSALVPPSRSKRGNITPEIATQRMLEPLPEPSSETPKNFLEPQNGLIIKPVINEPPQLKAPVTPVTPPLAENSLKANEAEIFEDNTEPQRLFRKVKTPRTKKPLESQDSERRATGFMRPEEASQLEQWLVNEETNSNNFENFNETKTINPNFHIEEVETLPLDADNDLKQKVNEDWLNSAHNRNDIEDIWQDMGVAVDFVDSKDLTQNIEQEFEKRRHSYLEHEGHFLELNEKEIKPPISSLPFVEDWPLENANKDEPAYAVITKNSNSKTIQPTGFGETIDEDWENFQRLQQMKDLEIENEWSKIEATTTAATTFSNTPISTEFEEHSKFQNQQLLSSATAYVQSIEELYDELSDADDYDNNNKFGIETNTEAVSLHEEIPLSPTPKTSILKEHIQIFENSNYQGPTAATRKLKSQQKVTFDVNTEEYYLPESESDIESESEQNGGETEFKRTYFGDEDDDELNEDEDDDDDNDNDEVYKQMTQMPPPPLPRTPAPTPMQRVTKMQNIIYDDDDDDEEQSINTTTTSTTWQQQTLHTSRHEEVRKFEQEIYINQSEQQQQQYQQQTAALLFSTQISLDEHQNGYNFNSENDSWTAIRQRRYQNEEFQEFQQESFLQQHESEVILKPQPSPRLGHREIREPAPRSIRKPSFEA